MQKKLLTKFNTIYEENSPEIGHRGTLPQYNKGHIWQTHSKHHSQWGKTENISSKIRNETRMSTLITIIQNSFWSPSHGNQRKKRNKRIQIEKEEIKLSLFADDMILYLENSKNATRKLLELINEFGKVAGYKINAKKSLAFIYTNNENSESEIRENSHLPLQQNE